MVVVVVVVVVGMTRRCDMILSRCTQLDLLDVSDWRETFRMTVLGEGQGAGNTAGGVTGGA
ncbi:hypothetical protein E2C01_057369 [Portunus trituberculatus]|uniref:Uncharacterized protein n=1 Tax=Portunus trituberculatus TaxID=210409 RepID=A0A5B7GZT4_PORTR|nr:hypothetical protein [Portunus trituberculatus]